MEPVSASHGPVAPNAPVPQGPHHVYSRHGCQSVRCGYGKRNFPPPAAHLHILSSMFVPDSFNRCSEGQKVEPLYCLNTVITLSWVGPGKLSMTGIADATLPNCARMGTLRSSLKFSNILFWPRGICKGPIKRGFKARRLKHFPS